MEGPNDGQVRWALARVSTEVESVLATEVRRLRADLDKLQRRKWTAPFIWSAEGVAFGFVTIWLIQNTEPGWLLWVSYIAMMVMLNVAMVFANRRFNRQMERNDEARERDRAEFDRLSELALQEIIARDRARQDSSTH